MRIFFSGIGGVGIGPLALIARDMGYEVLGSDAHASRYTDIITQQKIQVFIPQTEANVEQAHKTKPLDWFVYTAALPPDHPELVKAKQLGLRVSKRDEFLNQIINDRQLQLIAVSGTHGKTTTTGLLIWLFNQLGRPASYAIGTNISFGPSGHYQPDSRYFIYEADEYDRNMLQFSPFASVIPSIDFDHTDTYRDQADYWSAFRQFILQSHCVFMWRHEAEAIGGLPDGVVHTSGVDDDLSLVKLAGHNQRNAWLAIQCLHSLFPDISLQRLADMANRFPGTERRFEKLQDNLYTDYAHHPTEIASTIDLARGLNKNVVVVYQPHQNLRQHELNKSGAYKGVFDKAKAIYWLPTYLSREPEHSTVLSPDDLIKDIHHQHIQTARPGDSLKAAINNHLADGDLVLIMGAGDIDAWARDNFSH